MDLAGPSLRDIAALTRRRRLDQLSEAIDPAAQASNAHEPVATARPDPLVEPTLEPVFKPLPT
jgi:5,10-methenyltetrahydromethanopterin hydrogenase